MRKGILAASVAIAMVGQAPAYAQQPASGPPAPCGPKGMLPADFSQNVATDSRCFELRMYTAEAVQDGKGGIDDLHQRFREKEVQIFVNHGAEVIAVWQSLGNPHTLVWMLAYRDRAHREQVWEAFRNDPEWHALRVKYDVPLKAETVMMSAADYSPLK